MIKTLIGIGLAAGVGYVIGHYTQVGASALGEPVAQRPDMPPLRRMTQDILFMIDNLRPALVDLDQAYADNSLSVGELRDLYGHIDRLT